MRFLSGALSVSASVCHILRHNHTHAQPSLSLSRALSLSLSLGYHQYKRIEGGVALETHPSSSNYASFPYSVPDFLGRLERGGVVSQWVKSPPLESECEGTALTTPTQSTIINFD